MTTPPHLLAILHTYPPRPKEATARQLLATLELVNPADPLIPALRRFLGLSDTPIPRGIGDDEGYC